MKFDTLKKELFKEIVGQERAKKQISYFLEGQWATGRSPNFLLRGARGMGKTTIAKEIGKHLIVFEGNKPVANEKKPDRPLIKGFLPVECSRIKNLDQFINGFIIKHDVPNKAMTLFLDEAHSMPQDMEDALLVMLNPNREGRNTYIYDEYELTFDFRLHTFIFATSEPQKLLDTLKDRLQPIDLEEYTPDQMERIIQLGAKDVTFKDGVLSEMATVLRGNARQAQNMAEIILTGLKGGHTFGRKEWENLKFSLDIYPLGLNPTEIQVLKILADRPQGTSLTNLAARTTLTKDALQKDYEMYLQKHGLMQITTAGREITAKGLEYLRSLLNQPQFRSKRVIS